MIDRTYNDVHIEAILELGRFYHDSAKAPYTSFSFSVAVLPRLSSKIRYTIFEEKIRLFNTLALNHYRPAFLVALAENENFV